MRLILAGDLIDQLDREAREAFPEECCGLIAGLAREGDIVALSLHPARNRAGRPDRFEIDPAEQFRLLRALRGTERRAIGCYHSHPNGRPGPSVQDRAGAGEAGFVWLIAAIAGPDATADLGAFLWQDGEFRRLDMG